MFIGVQEIGRIQFTVLGLPSFQRSAGETPMLEIESLVGNRFAYKAMLVPKSKNVLIAKVQDFLAEKTIEANQVEQIGELGFGLENVAPRLREISVKLGENPQLAVAECFGVKAWHDVLRILRYARWILNYATTGLAFRHLKEIFDEVMRLVEYLPGLPTSPMEVWYAQYEPRSIFGVRVIRLLDHARPQLEAALKAALNNPDLILLVETAETFDSSLAQEAVQSWDKHYGEMWGPFLDKQA